MRFGFVSTYPPTQCGLATFTTSLRTALLAGGAADEGWVVRLVEAAEAGHDDAVVAQLVQNDPTSLQAAAARLDDCDAVILQHEYGIYGGRDGAEILDLLDCLNAPTIVVLHTVLTDPGAHQREILEAVVGRADAVVTMTATARDRLAAHYRVDLRKVGIIAHGAHEPLAGHRSAHLRPTILTWGLIGPGKGIEWGIAAMARLREHVPSARYLIAGQTHPKVLLHEGEAYRTRLQAQVRRLGLGANVEFDSHYRDAAALDDLVAGCDVVLLPYDSTEQVTSGVLIEAVAAGRPVVATRFPHAVELLGGGAGTLVRHRDPDAIATALQAILTDGVLAGHMATAAASVSPHLRWSAVAEQYRTLATRVISAGIAA